jgi:hypothetical protein
MTWLKRLDGTWQEKYEIEICIGKKEKKQPYIFLLVTNAACS